MFKPLQKKYHFWYSLTQDEMGWTMRDFEGFLDPLNYAEIDGKIVKHTMATPTHEHKCLLDDLYYLGEGIFHHSEARK